MCIDPEVHVSGPGAEWYYELAETLGKPWPVPRSMVRATHRELARRQAEAEAERARLEAEAEMWTCEICGGPRVCPDLAATLAYPPCGYAETEDRTWVHA
jgi:hypothetical protein